MLAFGRECVASPVWRGRVPLILVDAHKLWFSLQPEPGPHDYWQQPEVWADIESAFDRFFELNPQAVAYYQTYVWFAYHARQWDKLAELLPKLDRVDYRIFGGKAGYEEMLRQLAAHTKKTTATQTDSKTETNVEDSSTNEPPPSN
jgi:hypothetical protein